MTRRHGVIALIVGLLLAAAWPLAPAGAQEPATDPDAVWIDEVFGLFLGRAATEPEHARWGPTVELGHRHALTRSLSVSDEWAGVRIDDLYRTVLGRPADAGGRTFWVGHVAAGATLEQVAAHLFGSDEYFAGSGSTSGGFVDRLYVDLLGRTADPAGRSHWVDRIDAGTPRSEIAGGFHASIESRRSRVIALFDVVLERDPDREGRRYWEDQLRHLGDVRLAAFLASSAEHYTRTTGATAPPQPAQPARGTGTGFQTYASIGPVLLTHIAAATELVGFHQAQHRGSQQQVVVPSGVPTLTMSSRYRGTGARSAADIVVPPDAEIRSPVTGTVTRAETYALYCRYSDDRVFIEPDGRPGWEVAVLHIDGAQVRAGDRVVAGLTTLAPRATVLPFDSQVDRYGASPPWPHVHVEVVDLSIPDDPSGGC